MATWLGGTCRSSLCVCKLILVYLCGFEICALLGYYAASSGYRHFGTTYWSHLLGPQNMGLISCPETSVKITTRCCVISQKSADLSIAAEAWNHGLCAYVGTIIVYIDCVHMLVPLLYTWIVCICWYHYCIHGLCAYVGTIIVYMYCMHCW
jgi:hypothetical protein